MRWTDAHDILLCREILLIKPYQHKPGSKESGNAWTSVSDDLNCITDVCLFSTTQKSVRDRYRLLLEKYKKKMRQQEASSGSNDEPTELDNLLENIKEEVDVSVSIHTKISNEKEQGKQKDSDDAQEIRQNAMETLSESRKRKGTDQGPRTKRNSGSETMNYLMKRSERDFELRQKEMEIKKSELELQKQQQMLIQKQMTQQMELMNSMLGKFINK